MRQKESWLLSLSSAAGLLTAVYRAFVAGMKTYLYESALIPLVRDRLQS